MGKFPRRIFAFNYRCRFSCCAVDRTFSCPFAQICAFDFARVHNAGSPGVVLQGLALRAALVHRRPGPCNARDALGAHGSRREM